MISLKKTPIAIGTLGLAISFAAAAGAQEFPQEGPVPTTALISINSKHDVQLDPSMLKLQVNRHDSPITSVTPLVPQRAQVAILIDDGLRGNFALQLTEVKNFLNELPPGTKALIGYMQNGTVRSAGFSANHEELASQLRIPLSIGGAASSPYFSLSEFVKQWPSNKVGPRPSVMNQDSPYVQTAQEDAQRAGVAVYSIYYPDAGMRGGSFSGQSYLAQIGEATGGQSFYMGSIPPVSFKPYLEQFRKAILDSYAVTFKASATREKRDTLTPIKLTTTQQGVKIIAPQSVHPGVVE
jgi:hypothetical protein